MVEQIPNEITPPAPEVGKPIGTKKEGLLELSDFEKQRVLAYVKRTFDESRRFYTYLRYRWYLTEKYLEGYQLAGGMLNGLPGDVPLDYFNTNRQNVGNVDEEYFVDNILLSFYMRLHARLTRYKSNVAVFPNSEDESDKEASRVGRIMLYDLLDRNNVDKLKRKISLSLLTYGKAFVKAVFNKNKGRMIQRPISQSPQLDAMGIPVTDSLGNPVLETQYEDQHEGEIELRVVNPRNVTVSARSLDMDTLDWWQESNIMPVDAIFREYGVVVKSEKVSLDAQEFSSPSGLNFGMENREELNAKDAKVAVVHERYVRACPDFPEGAIIVWTNDSGIIRCSTLKDYYDDIPVADSDCIERPSSFWSDTPVFHVLPHQDEINRLESEIMRHTKLTAKPKLLAHQTTQLAQDAWNDETGEMIKWQGEHEPKWSVCPELPQGVYENLNRMVERMQNLISVHDVGMRSHISGNTVAYMQEVDESNYAPVIDSIGTMWNHILSLCLKIAADFYDTPRMIRMTGREKISITQDFVGSMLGDNFTVHCEMMSGLPSNKLARQQVIYQAVDKGILDKNQAGRALEFGEFEEELEKLTAEKELAERGAKVMEQGIMVPAHEWDNHSVWSETLIEHMKRGYDSWPPQIQQLFDKKLEIHQMALSIQNNPMDGPPPGLTSAGANGMIVPGQGAGPVSGQMPPETPGNGPTPSQAAQPFRENMPPSGSLQNA